MTQKKDRHTHERRASELKKGRVFRDDAIDVTQQDIVDLLNIPDIDQENIIGELDLFPLNQKLSEIHEYLIEDIEKLREIESQLRDKTRQLEKRIKELNCLYGISKLIDNPQKSIETILRQIISLVPSALQFPDITCVRIQMNDHVLTSPHFKETNWRIEGQHEIAQNKIQVQVYYLEKRPLIDESPFLKEERKLVSALAERVAEIIEHKKAIEMWQSERDKFQSVLFAIGEGVYIVNHDYLVEYQNEVLRERFGNIIGETCYKKIMRFEHPCDFCPLEKVLATGEIERVEIMAADGRNYEFCASRFKDNDGMVKLLQLTKDITEKKKLETEAMRASHLASLGELAAGVAHEINNPINSVINLAQIIINESKEDSIEYDISNRIIKESDRIVDIVGSLLSFAREKKKGKNPIEIRPLIEETLDLTRAQLRKDYIHLNLSFKDNHALVHAHGQQLQQVFLNLINNSRYALNEKYANSHQKKRLTIETKVELFKNKSFVHIMFFDNGSGIKDTNIDKVLLPFYTSKPVGKGTGLGLSISHGIISDHGGWFEIESEYQKYTRIAIRLPMWTR